MQRKTVCLLALAFALAVTPSAVAQLGTHPNDMHIDQFGYPVPGVPVQLFFRVTDQNLASLNYQAAVSQGWQPGIPVPGGVVPLAFDTFFLLSVQNLLPGVFSGFGGKLQNGMAQGSITLPPSPLLTGFSLWMSYIVYDQTGIKGISRAHKFQVFSSPQTAVAGNTPTGGIEVLDLDGRAILTSVMVGSFAQAPFYDLKGDYIFSATWGGLLNKVDITTNTVVKTLQFSTGVNNCVGGTTAMVTRTAGTVERGFVCNAQSAIPSVVEFDPVAMTEIKNHSLPAVGRAAGISVRPFSEDALITCFLTAGNLLHMDLKSGTVNSILPSIGLIDNPQDAVWRPQGDWCFVAEYGGTANPGKPTIWAMNQDFKTYRKFVVGTTMPGAAGISMAPDGSYFYCDVDNGGKPVAVKVDANPTSSGFGTVIGSSLYPSGWASGGWMCRNYDGTKAYVLLTTGIGELDTRTGKFNTTIIPTTTQAAIFNVRQRQDL